VTSAWSEGLLTYVRNVEVEGSSPFTSTKKKVTGRWRGL
jgi:hypothetical protein